MVALPDQSRYVITATPAMPDIQATAKVVNADPDPTATTTFTWAAGLSVPKGKGPPAVYDAFLQQQLTTTGSAPYQLKTVDPATIVGGDLKLTVTAMVAGHALQPVTTTTMPLLKIVGTNPQRVVDIQSEVEAAVTAAPYADWPDRWLPMLCSASLVRSRSSGSSALLPMAASVQC